VRKVSRRAFLRTAIFGSSAVACGVSLNARSARAATKPNLLVFLPDELRADLITGSARGSVLAPHLQRLASQSVLFERAYVTQPICTPSRSTLLTGMWPHQIHCTDNKDVLPLGVACLPEMLRDDAYRTGYFGKWHLGDEFSAQRGFQEWISIEDSFKRARRSRRTTRKSDYTQFLLSNGYKPDMHNGKYFSIDFPSTLPFELSKPKFLETKACDFLERHRHQPFVLFVAFFEPHPPYNGPFNDEHPLDAVRLDSTADNIFGEDMPLRYRLWQEFFRNQNPTAEHYRQTKQRYLGLIAEIDRSIGAILDKLDELDLSDHTIIALTSDHGDMMSGHGLLGKQLMFEQSASVPYLVRVPETSPSRVSQQVSHVDFVPTMLDLLGKPPHRQCVGQSRANSIRGEIAAPGLVFLEWSPGKNDVVLTRGAFASRRQIQNCLLESTRAVVSPDGWKLCLRDKDKCELYNLRDDSDERHNLYHTDEYPDVIARLTAKIHNWQRRIGDSVKV
jgi:arylsulfatase A-like enzyme